ncbi:MAG: transposase [Bacteroidota bacterium]
MKPFSSLFLFMTERFRNKYRTTTVRMRNWDYSWNAYYFVTICTRKRVCYFGEIRNGEIILTEIGKLIEKYWYEIPNHFKNIVLDEFVIMPNHIHGILKINAQRIGGGGDPNQCSGGGGDPNQCSGGGGDVAETPGSGVSTAEDFKECNRIRKWKPGTLGVIINQFKRICTINSRKINPDFNWQSRFNDHVIRDEISLNNIRRYIQLNPQKWNDDDFKKGSG